MTTETELIERRRDMKDIWNKLGSLENVQGQIEVMLRERCTERHTNIQNAILRTNDSLTQFIQTQSRINRDVEKRVSSLERTRSWIYGAFFIMGLIVGKALPIVF